MQLQSYPTEDIESWVAILFAVLGSRNITDNSVITEDESKFKDNFSTKISTLLNVTIVGDADDRGIS